MNDETARKPRRKTAHETSETHAPHATPPGPNTLEIRINGKIALLQRVHTYTIDQTSHDLTLHAVVRPDAQP